MYNVSQDHLALYFAALQSRYDNNNNSSCYEFQSRYKLLLVKTELRAGGLGSCISLDQLEILSDPPKITEKIYNSTPESLFLYSTDNDDHDDALPVLSDIQTILSIILLDLPLRIYVI